MLLRDPERRLERIFDGVPVVLPGGCQILPRLRTLNHRRPSKTSRDPTSAAGSDWFLRQVPGRDDRVPECRRKTVSLARTSPNHEMETYANVMSGSGLQRMTSDASLAIPRLAWV